MWRSDRAASTLYYAMFLGLYTLVALVARIVSVPQPWLNTIYGLGLVLLVPVVAYSLITHVLVPLRALVIAVWHLHMQGKAFSLVLGACLLWVGVVIGCLAAGQSVVALVFICISLVVLDRAYAGAISWPIWLTHRQLGHSKRNDRPDGS